VASFMGQTARMGKKGNMSASRTKREAYNKAAEAIDKAANIAAIAAMDATNWAFMGASAGADTVAAYQRAASAYAASAQAAKAAAKAAKAAVSAVRAYRGENA